MPWSQGKSRRLPEPLRVAYPNHEGRGWDQRWNFPSLLGYRKARELPVCFGYLDLKSRRRCHQLGGLGTWAHWCVCSLPSHSLNDLMLTVTHQAAGCSTRKNCLPITTSEPEIALYCCVANIGVCYVYVGDLISELCSLVLLSSLVAPFTFPFGMIQHLLGGGLTPFLWGVEQIGYLNNVGCA